jgi:drug/metabolite transporter (DMT)-like permease
VVALTELFAIYCVMKAIASGNATYVSLIESSHPIFVIFFSYLLFKDNHLSWQVGVGAVMIIGGVALISSNKPENLTTDQLVEDHSTAKSLTIKKQDT